MLSLGRKVVVLLVSAIIHCSFLPTEVCSQSQQFRDTPPMYSMDKLPQTRFTCEGKLTGRYYADPETDCQMFHVCAKMSRRDTSDFRFLCPNGTVFDQEHQVCADFYQVVCQFGYGTNPLGQIFEIFKLSSKESTNQREFGHVPRRDPDYLGQNTLGGGEDFQVEEYNNNKLASSQNALFPNVPSKTASKQNIFFSHKPSVKTTTTTTTARPTTAVSYVSTTEYPIVFQTTRENFVEANSKTTRKNEISQMSTFSTAKPTQSAKFVFSDFASLAKFQAQFHGLVTHAPKKPAQPTTTESYTTRATFRTREPESIDYNPTTFPSTTFVTSPAPPKSPSTTRRPEGKFHFTDFDSLSKFQENFHKSYAAPTTTESETERQTNFDFNTRPRSGTNPPLTEPTTRRPSFYQNTFRTTFIDLTTPSPQTFQQQPSRFDEEFFRKVVAQNELKSEVTQNQPENVNNGNDDSFSSTAQPTRRGGRRRINPNRRHKYSKRVENARFEDKESFTVRERTHASKVEEIFNAEASIFPRPAEINKFYSQEKYSLPLVNETKEVAGKASQVLLSGGERDVFGRRIRPFKEGKRVNLNLQSELVPSTNSNSDDRRPQRRPIKRLRVRTSTEPSTSETFISPTTYRPSVPIQFKTVSTSFTTQTTEEIPTTGFPITTTTEEPEIVTASDAEIEYLRKKNKFPTSTEGTLKFTSVRVIPKSSKTSSSLSFKKIEKPIKKTNSNSEEDSGIGSTKSPDYDYTYYDTDLDNDYADSAKGKFGKKSTKVIIKS